MCMLFLKSSGPIHVWIHVCIHMFTYNVCLSSNIPTPGGAKRGGYPGQWAFSIAVYPKLYGGNKNMLQKTSLSLEMVIQIVGKYSVLRTATKTKTLTQKREVPSAIDRIVQRKHGHVW